MEPKKQQNRDMLNIPGLPDFAALGLKEPDDDEMELIDKAGNITAMAIIGFYIVIFTIGLVIYFNM